MASSENFAAIEPWTFRSPFSDSWISSESLISRENEVLTKALQASLFSNHPETVSPELVPLPVTLESPDPPRVHLRFKSDPDLTAPKRPKSVIGKKKLRKSKRDSMTTFIMADPANFRQMVQQVTGERLSGSWRVAAAAPLKPQPQRLVNHGLMQGCLPTIDTSSSAFLLNSSKDPHHDRHQQLEALPPATLKNPSLMTNFDPLSCFPTLESFSWNVL